MAIKPSPFISGNHIESILVMYKINSLEKSGIYSEQSNSGEKRIILGRDGQILYQDRFSGFNQDDLNHIILELKDRENTIKAKIGNIQYLISAWPIEKTGWTFLTLRHYDEISNAVLRNLLMNFILFAV